MARTTEEQMTRYRRAWTWTAVLVATVGGCLALVSWPLLAAVSLMLAAGSVVLGTTAALADQGTPGWWRRPMRLAILGAVAVLATGGLADTLGGSGLALATLILLSAPPVVEAVRRRLLPGMLAGRDEAGPAAGAPPSAKPARGDRAHRPAEVEDPQVKAPALAELDDAGLCLAWRRSFVALQRAATPSCRADIVVLRVRLLDEMERRNPSGFALWLASGARAASDPTRFISATPEQPH
jgi:hypothetical protein